MVTRQTQLQELLEDVLGSGNVYFQPPSNVTLLYPCIIYNRDNADEKFAGNQLYNRTQRYQVTVIDREPDSGIPDKVAELPMCSFDRWYAADNLNHDVFTIFF